MHRQYECRFNFCRQSAVQLKVFDLKYIESHTFVSRTAWCLIPSCYTENCQITLPQCRKPREDACCSPYNHFIMKFVDGSEAKLLNVDSPNKFMPNSHSIHAFRYSFESIWEFLQRLYALQFFCLLVKPNNLVSSTQQGCLSDWFCSACS